MREGEKKPLTACHPVSGEDKQLSKRKGKGRDEARANRGLRRRLRLFQSFRVWRSKTHNGQLPPSVWWRGSQSEPSSTPAPVRRLKHRGPVPLFYSRPVPCGKGSLEKSLECRKQLLPRQSPRARIAPSWARSRVDSQPALCGTLQRL